MLQKLADKGLLKYIRFHGVELTEKGANEARRLLRKHRLLETLFVRSLGYDVQKACEEASRLDYRASEELANSISRNYEHPQTCPCNKTIFSDEMCRDESWKG